MSEPAIKGTLGRYPIGLVYRAHRTLSSCHKQPLLKRITKPDQRLGGKASVNIVARLL